MSLELEDLLHEREVMELLGVSRVALWRARKDGRIPSDCYYARSAKGVGNVRMYYSKSKLEKWLATQFTAGGVAS